MFDDLVFAAGAGIAAGLAIAMPVGAIATLLLRESIVCGFRVGTAGALGIATVDLSYCTVAMLTGSAFSPLIEQHRGQFLIVSGLLILAVGLQQLVAALRRAAGPDLDVEPASATRTYLRFLGLTAVNPATLLYFIALAGAMTTRGGSWVVPVVFVVAVGASSLAWQLALAATGSLVGRRLSPRATRAVGLIASALILGLGAALTGSGVIALA